MLPISASVVVSTIFVGAALSVIFFYAFIKPYDNGSSGVVPHYPGSPIIGSLFEISSDVLLGFVEKMTKIYGGIFTISVFHKKLLVVSDPMLIREIQQKQPKHFRRTETFDYPCHQVNSEFKAVCCS